MRTRHAHYGHRHETAAVDWTSGRSVASSGRTALAGLATASVAPSGCVRPKWHDVPRSETILASTQTNDHETLADLIPAGLNDSAVAAYYSLMVESASLLGASRQEAERQLLDVLNFETTLANVSVFRRPETGRTGVGTTTTNNKPTRATNSPPIPKPPTVLVAPRGASQHQQPVQQDEAEPALERGAQCE